MSDQPSIEYRPFTRADEDGIVDLLTVSMKMQEFPDLRGFWRWKHYENPFGESPGMVAIGEGKVVGLRVFLRWEWQAGDRVYRAGRAIDTSTHPEWGRRGIFETLTTSMLEQVSEEGMHFIFNTPNQYSMPGYLKMGWVLVGRLPLLVKVRRPVRFVRAAAGGGGLGGATEIKAEADNSAVLDLLGDSAVRAVVNAADASDGADANQTTRLHTRKSAAYLEWRYGRNRWYQYKAGFDTRGDSGALVICRSSRRGNLNELLVTDVVTLPDAGSRRLASKIIGRLAREASADYVALSGLDAVLGIGSGFLPVGQRGPNMTVRLLGQQLTADVTQFGAWAATFGDLELF